MKKSAINFNFDFGLLLGGTRDRKKNVNDTRPDAISAFIYSEAHLGALAAFGVSYNINSFSLGAETQVNSFFIESGWDRWGSDEEQESKFDIMPTIGSKIGYQINKKIGFEATIQFGESTSSAINLIIDF